MVFPKEVLDGRWICGKHVVLDVSIVILGIDFSYNGAWGFHIVNKLKMERKRYISYTVL